MRRRPARRGGRDRCAPACGGRSRRAGDRHRRRPRRARRRPRARVPMALFRALGRAGLPQLLGAGAVGRARLRVPARGRQQRGRLPVPARRPRHGGLRARHGARRRLRRRGRRRPRRARETSSSGCATRAGRSSTDSSCCSTSSRSTSSRSSCSLPRRPTRALGWRAARRSRSSSPPTGRGSSSAAASAGTMMLGRSLVVAPGSLADGSYAVADLHTRTAELSELSTTSR